MNEHTNTLKFDLQTFAEPEPQNEPAPPAPATQEGSGDHPKPDTPQPASLVEQAASRRLGFTHTVSPETVERLTGRVAELEDENARLASTAENHRETIAGLLVKNHDLHALLEAAERRESYLSHGMAPESRIDMKEAV